MTAIEVMPEPSNIEGWEELNAMDTDDLKRELGRVLGLTASNLIRAAAIVKIIESRGEDLSGLKTGLVGYLRKIAFGQVLPEVVASLMGHPALKRVAELPIPDQRRCLESDGLPIGLLVGGKIDVRNKPLLQFEQFELKQVFASDHIRNPEEQVAWLRSQQYRRPQFEESIERPTYTLTKRGVVINRPTELSKRDLENMLKALESA